MLYRDHRGSYNKSMDTTIEVKSEKELIDHLNKTRDLVPVEEIRIELYHPLDSRNGWVTYSVEYRLRNHKEWSMAGFSNSNKF